MIAKIILDTNIWVYLYSKSPIEKANKAREIFLNNFSSLVISTQILGEFFNVLSRKKTVSEDEAKEIIVELSTNFSITEIDTLKVLKAIEINSSYKYAYWDSLIIATALIQNCSILYSEDMQHEQVIENKTTIINPFL